MSGKIKILSLNIGMKDNLAGLVNFIINESLDIIFLQEVRMPKNQLQSKVSNFGYNVEVNINDEDLSKPGTALLWKTSIPLLNISVLVQCRCQVAFLARHILINVYAHSGSDKKRERGELFAKDIFYFLSLHPGSPLICGGDFNSILSAIDVDNGTGFPQKFCHQLSDLLHSKNLVDGFRFLYPNEKHFTFFRASVAASRLHRFYLSSDLLSCIQNVKHLPSLSDHFAVQLSLRLDLDRRPFKNVQPNRSYWKLNSAILDEEDFVDNFSDFWKYLVGFKQDFGDVADWWDLFVKPNLKEFCSLYSKRRARRKKDTINFLKNGDIFFFNNSKAIAKITF